MGSQKLASWIPAILIAIGGIVTITIQLEIPITNPFSRNSPTSIPVSAPIPTPSSMPTPSPVSIPTPTLIPTSTPKWNNWLETEKQVPYKELFRYAESHVGEKIYFQAKVMQAIENDEGFRLLAFVTPVTANLWDDLINLNYNNAHTRVLEGDIIHFVGIMEGLITYETRLGGTNTVPSLTVLKLIIE